MQNLGLADLIDIAQEQGTTNNNFGLTEGSTAPKIRLIRDLLNANYTTTKLLNWRWHTNSGASRRDHAITFRPRMRETSCSTRSTC